MNIALVIIALGALIWVGLRYATPKASPIAPDDPIWVAALQRARATLPEMRRLQRQGGDVWVKFPLQTAAGGIEHVWGRVVELEGDALRCAIETPPVARPAMPGREVVVTPAEIEDWQVQLDDGTIRGGFTTRAQAEIARRQGQPVPRHVEDMIWRMVVD